MSGINAEGEPNLGSKENTLDFESKLETLLPGMELGEPEVVFEARKAVLEALAADALDPDSLRVVWAEYAKVCEQVVDAESDPTTRAQLQIAMIVHKALIFLESGNTQRYIEELVDAGEYAFNMYLDDVAEAIRYEIESVADQ